uniref:Ig-like domain-containing protein n=1 Tax=Sander lucioperca TaxID=283035 RepID=A0A8D0A3W9_SANLU
FILYRDLLQGHTCRELLKQHYFLLLIVVFNCFSDVIVVTVHPGDNATLPCRAVDHSISVVEWIRPDLEPDIVLLYRDGHLDPSFQHPSFKGRVDLVDRHLKDRDVSLILKNVSRHDRGTYECLVITGDSRRTKRYTDSVPIRIIRTILSLHFCTDFKILLFVFKCLHGLAPQYLSNLLVPYTPSRSLRSADQALVVVPQDQT